MNIYKIVIYNIYQYHAHQLIINPKKSILWTYTTILAKKIREKLVVRFSLVKYSNKKLLVGVQLICIWMTDTSILCKKERKRVNCAIGISF
jgi:hypothetical protein